MKMLLFSQEISWKSEAKENIKVTYKIYSEGQIKEGDCLFLSENHQGTDYNVGFI